MAELMCAGKLPGRGVLLMVIRGRHRFASSWVELGREGWGSVSAGSPVGGLQLPAGVGLDPEVRPTLLGSSPWGSFPSP